MTYEMEYLMMLYACGAIGKQAYSPTCCVDWEKVVRLAVEQSITYTVAIALKRSDTGCPAEIRNRLTSSMLGASIANEFKTEGILKLIEELEKIGVHSVILKGIDAAKNYANPECRVSADTDILISPDDELKALALMEKEGCKINRRTKENHHSVCIHPKLGIIEIHTTMWEDLIDDVLFKNSGKSTAVSEPHRLVVTDSGNYYALGSTDALMFLTFHMIKHFITGGMSLRMMMDTALCLKNEKDNIDLPRYWEILHKLRYDSLINSIFGAMIKYCGFLREDFPGIDDVSDENISVILNDLEKGGWQGKNDVADRKDSWFYLKRERQIKEMGKFRFFFAIKFDILKDKLFAIFPTYEHLATSYPELIKHRWLYPVCMVRRLFSRGIKASANGKTKSRKNISDESILSESGRERLDVFKKLGMI